jgi:hypothetical protein
MLMTSDGRFYIIDFNIHDPVVTKFSPYVEINTLRVSEGSPIDGQSPVVPMLSTWDQRSAK